MKTELKSFRVVEMKVSKTTPGEYEAIVSVFGNVDAGGDRILKGAFDEVIASGKMPAIFWQHAWELGPIGKTLEWKAVEKGLWTKGQLFLDSGSDLVKRIHAAMDAEPPQVNDFSFAYAIATDGFKMIDEGGAKIREISKMSRVYEHGPVVAGMNDQTELLRVASLFGRKRVEAADPDVKGVEPIAGSFEQITDEVLYALIAAEGDGFVVQIDGMFADRVVYTIYKRKSDGYRDWNDDGQTFQRDYSYDDAGAVVLGDRAPVAVVATVVPASEGGKGVKHASAPSHIQKAHDTLVKAGAKCVSGDEGKSSSDTGVSLESVMHTLAKTRHEEATK